MNILVFKFEFFYCLLDFELQFESVFLNHCKMNNSNRGDVASLAKGYCSVTIRASQFSSTTRNLVPRFKSGTKGERSDYEILTNLLEEVNPFR